MSARADGWRKVARPAGWSSRIVPYVMRRDGGRCTWNMTDPDGRWWPRVCRHGNGDAACRGLIGHETGCRPLDAETYPLRAGSALRCGESATDVDHMEGAADSRAEVLRALCSQHHQYRNGAVSAAKVREKKAAKKAAARKADSAAYR